MTVRPDARAQLPLEACDADSYERGYSHGYCHGRGPDATTGVTGTTTTHTVTTSKVTTRVTTWDSMSACVVRKTRTRAQTQVAPCTTRGTSVQQHTVNR